MKIGLIVASSKIDSKEIILSWAKKADYIICADGGYLYLKKLNIRPDLIVGDFDSSNIKESEGIKKDVYSSKKDETDLEIAIKKMIELGYINIIVLGALYGRLDHTYANIQLLKKYKMKNIDISLIGEEDQVYTTDNFFSIDKKENHYISLFSLTENAYVEYTKGLKYSLKNSVLTNDNPLGVSNEIKDNDCQIKIKDGILLIIVSKNNPYRE